MKIVLTAFAECVQEILAMTVTMPIVITKNASAIVQ